MSHLLDEVARALADPVPRRTALRLVGSVVTGGLLSSLGIKNAWAIGTCGGKSFDSNHSCCTSWAPPFILTKPKTCCGQFGCDSNHSCCTTGSSPFLVSKPKSCCGNFGCDNEHICCTTSSQPFLCNVGQTCCGNTYCEAGHYCCGTQCCSEKCVNGKCPVSSICKN